MQSRQSFGLAGAAWCTSAQDLGGLVTLDQQIDFIMNQLNFLTEWSMMDPDQRNSGFNTFFNEASDQYDLFWKVKGEAEKERARTALEKQLKQERKEFDRQMENLSKTLPDVTKGVLNAISAFERNDPFTGSAAVMDICASIAPLLAGLSSAGGPPGMLVGAVFNMIGQILSFFAPKSESLSTQIKNILTELKADDNEQKIGAVQDSIRTYTISLREAMLNANNLLQDTDQPTDKEFAESVATQAGILANVVDSMNPVDGNTIEALWAVARWLREEKNQGQDKWPLVLGAWCQGYTDLLFTASMVRAFANTVGMRVRFDEAANLTSEDRATLTVALRSVRVSASAMLIKHKATTAVAVDHLNALIAPARDRGFLWQIDEANGGELYGGSQIRRGEFEDLDAQGKKIAIAASAKDLQTSIPTYHVFHVERGDNGRLYHGLSRYPYDKAPIWSDLGATVTGLTDIWATYGPGDDPAEIYFHGTKGNDIIGYVLKKDGTVRDGNYRLTLKSKANAVRVVRAPKLLTDDPDVDVKDPGRKAQPYVLYGGCEASGDIFVTTQGEASGYVPSPWGEYRGLGVDETYLWVFGSGGFACATHASMVRCLKKEIAQPRWMTHYPNELLYHSTYNEHASEIADRPPLRGLLSLSPCDDGTLVAAIAMRAAMLMPQLMRWSVWDSPKPPLYTGVYRSDIKAQKIQVAWTKLPDTTTGDVVQKVAVPCWAMLGSLNETLPRLAKVFKN